MWQMSCPHINTLFTNNDSVAFYVTGEDGTDNLANLGSHTTYTFTLFISAITQSTTQPGETLIFSDALGHPTTAAIEIADVTMAEIVADVAMGGKTYLGKTVRLEATVLTDTVLAEGIISLSTGNETVNFFHYRVCQP